MTFLSTSERGSSCFPVAKAKLGRETTACLENASEKSISGSVGGL